MTHTDVTLTLTKGQHTYLKNILFPSDGKEAVAIGLCGRRAGLSRHKLLVQEIVDIPLDACTSRSSTSVVWRTDSLAPLLNKAEEEGLSVIKFHSHPDGYADFSAQDDQSDSKLFPAIQGWVEGDFPHASVIMLPDDRLFGRFYWKGNQFEPLALICVVGPDLCFWYGDQQARDMELGFSASHSQAFGQGTTEQLRRLSIAVVGCSGTGSVVVEQLTRLGVGRLVLVDDDVIEERNLNRILNAIADHAMCKMNKADMLAEAVQGFGLGTNVQSFPKNLLSPDVVRAVAECDVVFGCMDTLEGRYVLNTIATHYLLPYFDLGVCLDAVPNGQDRGHIREICGTVHYLQPGRSSLMSRGLVQMESLRAEGLRRLDPEAYTQEIGDGYIKGVLEHRPAVISVNMYIAALAINDFLARLHPYREEPNDDIASIEFSLCSLEIFPEVESEPCPILQSTVGLGDTEPLLGLMEFAMESVV